jgi:glutathione peroxidase-family protein
MFSGVTKKLVVRSKIIFTATSGSNPLFNHNKTAHYSVQEENEIKFELHHFLISSTKCVRRYTNTHRKFQKKELLEIS